jgi:hypothetical protein
MLQVTYFSRNNYGTELYYPVSDDAKQIVALCKTLTLTDHALAVVEKFGGTVQEVLRPR